MCTSSDDCYSGCFSFFINLLMITWIQWIHMIYYVCCCVDFEGVESNRLSKRRKRRRRSSSTSSSDSSSSDSSSETSTSSSSSSTDSEIERRRKRKRKRKKRLPTHLIWIHRTHLYSPCRIEVLGLIWYLINPHVCFNKLVIWNLLTKQILSVMYRRGLYVYLDSSHIFAHIIPCDIVFVCITNNRETKTLSKQLHGLKCQFLKKIAYKVIIPQTKILKFANSKIIQLFLSMFLKIQMHNVRYTLPCLQTPPRSWVPT